jgi:hypothetical protein
LLLKKITTFSISFKDAIYEIVLNPNRMRPFLLVLFCCCGFATYAGRPDSSTGRPQPDYLDYFLQIADAETALVPDNIPQALNLYRFAFESYAWNNPKDCYVAAQASAYVGDTVFAADCLRRGLCSGLPLSLVQSNPHLQRLAQRIDKAGTDSCLAVYQSRINPAARAAILTLIRKDQALVHAVPPGESIYEGKGDRGLKPQYIPVWDSMLQTLIVLTENYGFPAEKVAGTQQGDDGLFRAAPHNIYPNPILVHHSRAWPQIGTLLTQQLHLGNITPQAYGLIYETSNGYASYQDPVQYLAIRPCQDRACKQLLKQKRVAIDTARRQIGLCSYEAMERKFEHRKAYANWRSKPGSKPEPVFDFQCELAFQGQ